MVKSAEQKKISDTLEEMKETLLSKTVIVCLSWAFTIVTTIASGIVVNTYIKLVMSDVEASNISLSVLTIIAMITMCVTIFRYVYKRFKRYPFKEVIKLLFLKESDIQNMTCHSGLNVDFSDIIGYSYIEHEYDGVVRVLNVSETVYTDSPVKYVVFYMKDGRRIFVNPYKTVYADDGMY